MPERDIDPGLEQRLEHQLRAYAEQGVRPFDAVQIAHRAAGGRSAGREGWWRGRLVPAPVMWILLSALMVMVLGATAFAAGLLPLPASEDPSPTPTTAAVSPSPSPAPATDEPTLEPTAQPQPTPSSTPTAPASPTLTPSAEPTASPSPAPDPITLGEWQRVDDFPWGAAFKVSAVTAGGPGYVAVGASFDDSAECAHDTYAGHVWTSPDGVAWTAHETGDAFAQGHLSHVVEFQGTLYAFGLLGTQDPELGDCEPRPENVGIHVWRSPDGVNWERLPYPPTFAESEELLAVVVAGNVLLAAGSRVEPGASTTQAGVWRSLDGIDWQPADRLPATNDIRDLAYADGVLVGMGNDPDSPPWRSLWYSEDQGRTWNRADAEQISDPDFTLEALGARDESFVAVGQSGRYSTDINEVYTVANRLTSGDGRSWRGGTLPEYDLHRMQRVVAVPGGFLALGDEVRYSISSNCAPGPCLDEEIVRAASWTSVDGLDWQAAADPPAPLAWLYAAIGVGADGVVMSGFNEESARGVWFAPLR
jgi:hypothetical protein